MKILRWQSIIAILLLSGILQLSLADDKVNIAVMELAADGISSSEARILTARLRVELFRTGAFVVLEREMMEEILREQNFQLSGCTSDECVVEAGRLTGVQQIVAGSIGKIGGIYTLNVRLIDVETGELISIATEDCKCSIETVLIKAMRRIAYKLSGMDYPVIDDYTKPVTGAESGKRKSPREIVASLFHRKFSGDYISRYAVYAELLGKGILTLNFEYKMNSRNVVSVGLGADPLGVTIPVTYSRIWKRRNKVLETGAGASLGAGDGLYMFLYGNAGFRREYKNGFLFRVSLIPLLYINLTYSEIGVAPSAGLSFGYVF